MLFLYINPYGQSLSLSAMQLHILLPFPLCRSLPVLCCPDFPSLAWCFQSLLLTV